MRAWIIPPEPLRVLWLLERAGYPAYIVGGSLRDALLGQSPHDWDVTTAARPEQMLTLFEKNGCRTIPTGLKHGTVTVLVDHCPIECTTFRIDGDYTDARHPDSVRFSNDIADDLSRRDFTVNAMACRVPAVRSWEILPSLAPDGLHLSAEDVELLDLFGGQDDLRRGVLRCVGHAEARFTEDALRMLRAVRFCVQLGFTPAPETEAALAVTRAGLAHVSSERIATELNRMLAIAGRPPSRGLALMSRTGLWDYVVPEATPRNHPYFSNESLLFGAIDALPCDAELRLALLLCGLGEQGVCAVGRRLKWSNRQLERVASIVRALSDPLPNDEALWSDAYLRRRMATHGETCEAGLLISAVCDLVPGRQVCKRAIDRCKQLRARGDCLSISALAVDGRRLMQECGVRGVAVGTLLQRLLDAVLDDPTVNTSERLLSFAKKMIS